MDNTNDTQYQLFVGIDRADAKLDIACTDPQGNTSPCLLYTSPSPRDS